MKIRQISMDQPWSWLSRGWRDLCTKPGISLCYGITFTLVTYILIGCLQFLDLLYMLLPLGAAFTLLGPMLAVGLYEASRRLETGEEVRLKNIAFVGIRSPIQLAIVGLFLIIMFLVWLRVATVLFALFFSGTTPNLAELIPTLILTSHGIAFLIVGSAIGAVLAFAVFAISAVSVPLLLDREVDAITAIITSIRSVVQNFRPMLLWAWLIAMLTLAGLVTLFFGLIVTFPLIGHATWHAYRDLIEA